MPTNSPTGRRVTPSGRNQDNVPERQSLRGQSVAQPAMMTSRRFTGPAGPVAGLAPAELRGAVPKEHG